MASAPLLHGEQKGKRSKQWRLSSPWAPRSLWTVTAARKSEDDCSWQETITNLYTVKKQRRDSADKGLYGQATDFPVVTYSCESWTVKKAKELMPLNCGGGEDS